MKQASLGLNLSTKKTRKREFLEEMERVVPWKVLVEIIEPYWPKSKTGRPPFAIETMLRIHYMQQWFGLSDPAMEEALHDVPLYLEFAGLSSGASRIPDETTILRFRHLLEKRDLAVDMLRVVNRLLQNKGLMLKTGTAVDAGHRPDRTPEGQRTGEGRARVPGGQAPVRAYESALSRAGQEHRPVAHAVRADESVAGATQVDGTGWTSPSDEGEGGMNRGRKGLRGPPIAIHGRHVHSISFSERLVAIATCWMASCSDLP